MAVWAKFKDGGTVSDKVFKVLARFAPSGTMDVFASDQHNSYLKLMQAFYEHIGSKRKADDSDVRKVCRLFAKNLRGSSTAALFNQLAFQSPGFRDLLGKSVMLIGRLEDTNTIKVDGERGQLAQLSIAPEECAKQVDGFKTLVKLNPDHKESWQANKEWLKDVYARCQKLNKPLFNETLLFQLPGESKAEFARRLPKQLVKVAKDFSPYGDFYKTQVPVLWTTDEDDNTVPISSPDVIRKTAMEMSKVSTRPMLLLSAAVDFAQYAAQYALVADIFAGPMCGRAYFKEAFTLPTTKNFGSLGKNFAKIALPRIAQIKDLASVVSKPWWHKYTWIHSKAKKLISGKAAKLRGSVKADYGY